MMRVGFQGFAGFVGRRKSAADRAGHDVSLSLDPSTYGTLSSSRGRSTKSSFVKVASTGSGVWLAVLRALVGSALFGGVFDGTRRTRLA